VSAGIAGDLATLAFSLVHTAPGAFSTVLQCDSTFYEVAASDIKVTAIRVGNLTPGLSPPRQGDDLAALRSSFGLSVITERGGASVFASRCGRAA
jgi:hypothetical protein